MKALLMVGVFMIAVVAFGLAMEEGGQRQATATAKAPAARPVVKAETLEEMLARLRPADQATLLVYSQAFKENGAAPNAIMRERVVAQWNKTYCDAVSRIKEFSNWTGKVSTIRENGYVEVNIGDYTWVVDINIKPGSPLFEILAGLRYDQPVMVSGRFEKNFCSSVWMDRHISVRLTGIRPL